MPNPITRSARQVRWHPMLLLVGVSLLSLRSAPAQLPVISLGSLSQSFFSPGESYQVSVRDGVHTDEVAALVFSHPGFSAELSTDDPRPFRDERTSRFGDFQVTVSPDVPEGQYFVRCRGRFGVSNPRRIVVRKDMKRIANAGSDSSTATPIATDTLYAHHTGPRRLDHYKLPVQKGIEYHLRLVGHCVDSAMLGAVAVVDASGRTVAKAIGSDRRDARLAFTAEQQGAVLVIVHDALYRGGAAFPYGLLVQADAKPIAGCKEPDEPQAFSVPEVTVPEVAVPSVPVVPVEESDHPVQIKTPSAVHATFDSPLDEDRYLFSWRKGQRLRIEVVSDRIGQPTDARLIVHRGTTDDAGQTNWQQVATADDQPKLTDGIVHLGSRDPALEFTVPADADYRVDLVDQDTGESLGASQAYQLIVSALEPSVDLVAFRVYPNKDASAARPSGSHLSRGDAMVLRVFAIRHGHASPIQITVSGLPEDVQSSSAWIAANQNQVDVVLTATDQVTEQLATLRVTGEFLVGDTVHRASARFASLVWPRDGYRPNHIVRLVDDCLIATSDRDTVPISIRPKSAATIRTEPGKKVPVPLQMIRRDGGKGSIVLRAKSLPSGVKVGDVTIEADKSEAQWMLDVSAGVKPGTYTFWAEGETKVKSAVNPQRLDRLNQSVAVLEKLRADPERSEDHAGIDTEITAIQKEIEAAKKQTAVRDFTIFIPMQSVTLQVQ